MYRLKSHEDGYAVLMNSDLVCVVSPFQYNSVRDLINRINYVLEVENGKMELVENSMVVGADREYECRFADMTDDECKTAHSERIAFISSILNGETAECHLGRKWRFQDLWDLCECPLDVDADTAKAFWLTGLLADHVASINKAANKLADVAGF